MQTITDLYHFYLIYGKSEKLMHKRLYFYLEQTKVFYPFQFGFRNQHSTTHALIEITEKIKEACDKGLFACDVYLDFKKAFDTVNHEILLFELRHYGEAGIANDWMRSFLTNRKQYLKVSLMEFHKAQF